MRVPIKWLKNYVELREPVSDIVAKLGAAGFEVERVWQPAKQVQNVVVGQIKRVRSHPNADRLKVCEVDVSQSPVTNLPRPPKGLLQIVTGAANIAEGQSEGAKVPVAVDGAVIHPQKVITASNLRGEDSAGMLCSLTELGLEEYSAGIAILNGDYLIGQDVMTALGFDEAILEVNVPPNRGDCLSLLGIARELAAIYARPLRLEDPARLLRPDNEPCPIKVTVQDHDACPRYMGRAIAGIRVEPSPSWMQTHLRLMGLRPINNVVDITNYVLFELGQPLHAFDADELAGRTLCVRRATAGEALKALNEESYVLTPNDLVIADGRGPVALAGVIGGERGATGQTTRCVFIEAAQFAPAVVHSAARRHSLVTDSSLRFERGVDFNGVPLALDRAAQLLQDFARGAVLRPLVDITFHKPAPQSLRLRLARIRQILGYAIDPDRCAQWLSALNFSVLKTDEEGLTVAVPSFRAADVVGETDLIEEVARLAGFDKIPSTLPQASITAQPLPQLWQWQRDFGRALAQQGLSEVVHFSMVSAKENQSCHLGQPYPALRNPLNPGMEALRTGLLAGLVRCQRHHAAQQLWDLAIFECGKAFIAEEGEQWYLAALLCGEMRPPQWQQRRAWDLYALKGLLATVWQMVLRSPLEVAAPVQDPRLHSGQSFNVLLDARRVGVAGKLSPIFTQGQDLPAELYFFELDLSAMAAPPPALYRAYSTFPAVRRDLSLVVEKQTHAAIHYATVQMVGGLLESVLLKDSFSSDKFGPGRKNLTYTLTYRAADRTLTDDEVNALHEKLKQQLRDQLHVETM